MRTVLALALLVSGAMAGCVAPEDNAWALRATQLDQLGPPGGAGASHRPVRVALLDTGIDLRHPALRHLADGDLFDGELAAQQSFVGDSIVDGHGHGTFLAGLLAARPRDGLSSFGPGADVQGFAPSIDLLVGRVCVEQDCSMAVLVHALRWALEEDADIISLSLGFTRDDVQPRQTGVVATLRDLLALAESRGVLVVAASANHGDHELFPASEPTVLSVGAVGQDLKPRNGRPCRDGGPDLVAPGEGIVGPWPGDGLAEMDGTSGAVPFVVAAAAALVASHGPPEDAAGARALRRALTSSTHPVGGGCGLLQAGAALQAYS